MFGEIGDRDDGATDIDWAAGDADDEGLGLRRVRGGDDGGDGGEVEGYRVRGVSVRVERGGLPGGDGGRGRGRGGGREDDLLVHGRVLGEAVKEGGARGDGAGVGGGV